MMRQETGRQDRIPRVSLAERLSMVRRRRRVAAARTALTLVAWAGAGFVFLALALIGITRL